MFEQQQNKLQLQDIAQYINRIDNLEIFLHNVSIEIPNINRKQIFGEINSQMTKSFTAYGLKVVNLWLAFLQRLDAGNFGVTIIHVSLLQFIVKQQLYKQAFKFVQKLRLPLTISLSKYRQYLLLSSQVYLEYEKYSQAFETLNLANEIQDRHIQPQFLTLKLLILTSLIVNRQIQKQDYIRFMDRVKLSCRKQIEQWVQQKPQKIAQLQFQVELFGKICQNKPLKPEELSHLQQKELLNLYLKSTNPQLKQLRKYIRNQIYNPILYRIKCTQINNHSISQFETVKNINYPTKIYKYDSKNSIMYFEHESMSQQELNEEIDKLCQMQEIIKTRPNIRIESMQTDRFNDDEREMDMEDERRSIGGGIGGGYFGRMMKGFFGR